MRETLVDLVLRENLQVISVVGLGKNTGKTTTLLYLVKHLGVGSGVLALTSTGRDGEAVDEITRKEKPRVAIAPGTLATTSERSLEQGRGLSRVKDTRYVTALGRIVIVRADLKGQVILEGPATVSETGELASSLIREEGALRVIIDGSLDRIAVATPDVSEGIVLATGAVLGPDIETVLSKTRHSAGLLMTERTNVVPPHPSGVPRFFATSADGAQWEVHEGSAISDPGRMVGSLGRGGGLVFISGAVSDGLLEALMAERLFPAVIVPDATRLFVSERAYAMFLAGGGKIEVEREIRLIAITINPHNPEGVGFEPVRFLEAMRAGIPALPIFDVLSEEKGGV